MKAWIYDEYKHCGVDYSDDKLADKYDEQHQKFRNYKKEFNDIIEFLSLKNTNELTIIDLGCGTGAISIYAAGRFKKVYGVDISDVMINQAKKKLQNKNVDNVKFIKSGFLSYNHQSDPVDLLITKAAFHHLPDFWKQIALLKMNEMIKHKGILYIFDIVFDFKTTAYKNKIDEWVLGFEKQAGKEFKKEVETHIRDEFSTFKWILDGMIEKAGFKIENYKSSDGFAAEYHCIKIDEIGSISRSV